MAYDIDAQTLTVTFDPSLIGLDEIVDAMEKGKFPVDGKPKILEK